MGFEPMCTPAANSAAHPLRHSISMRYDFYEDQNFDLESNISVKSFIPPIKKISHD